MKIPDKIPRAIDRALEMVDRAADGLRAWIARDPGWRRPFVIMAAFLIFAILLAAIFGCHGRVQVDPTLGGAAVLSLPLTVLAAHESDQTSAVSAFYVDYAWWASVLLVVGLIALAVYLIWTSVLLGRGKYEDSDEH